MARIKIHLPKNRIATVIIPVRITDINYGNHLGNDSLVGILHEARVQWLKVHGYTELNAAGTGLIMGDLAVEYVGESFYPDVFSVAIAAGEITRVGFELIYEVTTTRDHKEITIARAKTGMLCFDYAKRKVASVPEMLLKMLTNGII